MSETQVSVASSASTPAGGRVGRRLHRADEADRDVACGVHRRRRHGGRACASASGAGDHGADPDRDGRGRGGRAQHVVRRRHRRPDAAHRKAADPARTYSARGGGGLWAFPRGVFGAEPWAAHQLGRGVASRGQHRLLSRRVHALAEAANAAEHRDRRRGGRAAAHDRLGSRVAGRVVGELRALPDRLPLDAAAFLGAGAVPLPRLRPRWRADDAERVRPGSHPPGNS